MEMVVEVNGVVFRYIVETVEEAIALTFKLTAIDAMTGKRVQPERVIASELRGAGLKRILARNEENDRIKTESAVALLRRVQEAGDDGIRGGILMRDVHANGPAMKLLIEQVEAMAIATAVTAESVVVRKRLASGTTWYPGPNIGLVIDAFSKEVPA